MNEQSLLNKYYKRFTELRPEFRLKNGGISKSKKSYEAQSRLIWVDKKLGTYFDAWARCKSLALRKLRGDYDNSRK